MSRVVFGKKCNTRTLNDICKVSNTHLPVVEMQKMELAQNCGSFMGRTAFDDISDKLVDVFQGNRTFTERSLIKGPFEA